MTAKNYGLIESIDQLTKFVDRMIGAGTVVSIDIETGYDGSARVGAALHPEETVSKVVGISFTNSTGWARYVPLGHDLGNNLDNRDAAQLFWKLLNSAPIIAHNHKFELRFLRQWFLRYLPDDASVIAANGYYPVFSDTMIEAYIAQLYPQYGLKYLTKALFGHEQADLMSLFPGLPKNKAKTLRFNTLTLEPHVVSYACEDALWCLALHEIFYPQVKDRFIYKTEMQVLPIVCEMEDYGVAYDWGRMEVAAAEAEKFMEKFDAEIQLDLSRLADKPILINLNSPAQLRTVLFDELGMKSAKSTPSGLESTGAIAMETLSKKYPVVRKILDLKEIKTLITKFLDKYPKTYNYAPDGRSHPNYLQANVISGRFAVSDPNFQQSPKEFDVEIGERGKVKVTHYYQLATGETFDINFREYVISPPEHYILGFDYSQIELRVLAGEAQEPYLVKAFEDGVDIHTAAASLLFGIPREEVTKLFRDKAKTLQFALLYQMGVKSLADRLGITKDEAQKLFDLYFASFSNVAAWIERVTGEAIKNGYSQSRLGRIHRIWDFHSGDSWIYSRGERLAVNAPIQGTAADIAKVAMVRCNIALKKANLLDRVHMVMNIHDALEFYVHESVDPQTVISVLYNAVIFPLPNYPTIEAEWHVGSSWGTVQKLVVDTEGIITGGLNSFGAVGNNESKGAPIAAPVSEHPALVEPKAPSVESIPEESVLVPFEFDAPDHVEPSRRLIVKISSMPTREQYQKFLSLVTSCTGNYELMLNTPQGELLLEQYRIGLTPKDQAQISMALGGAEVVWSQDSIDSEELVGGLVL